jgi:translation initiation factor 3 subunit E
LNISAHWGKLASDILTGKWEVALKELTTLRDAIDSRTPSALLTAPGLGEPAQLHARTWLVHWSLFVFFNHPQGRTLLLETFLAPAYLNTIQTACPWVLRYLVAAAILSRTAQSARARHAIKDVVRIVQAEEYQYTDPVTGFLKELYVEFDFEASQKELTRAVEVVGNDFFLGDFKDEFLDNARYLISEAYCRIHQRIDIG